ncbi:protein NrdI [Erysipelotrichaceae bacterium]|nr:protein NrdI [Erysipelotrichaceae bacterium]
MLVVFYSETGNVAEFVEKTGLESLEVISGSETTDEKFVVVVPTTGDGDVPDAILDFLEAHADQVVGVAASGNMGWEDTYCFAADVISEQYNVPTLLKFEDEGTDEDTATFKEAVAAL